MDVSLSNSAEATGVVTLSVSGEIYSESRERGPPGPRASRRAIDQTREQGVQAPRREEGWEVSLV